MPSLRVKVPDPLRILIESQHDSLAKGAKERIATSLARFSAGEPLTMPPVLLPSSTCVIYLAQDQMDALTAIATPQGWTPGQAAESLQWTAAQAELATRVAEPLIPEGPNAITVVNDRLKSQDRPEQALYFQALQKFILGGVDGVLFAEASTGVGKTRAYLTGILEWCAANPGRTAVVAAPTYQVLAQVHGEWQLMASAGPTPPVRIIFGQSAFISESALLSWMERAEQDEFLNAARQWASRGAPPSPDGLCDAKWTVEGLEAACGGAFPDIDDIMLDQRMDDVDAGLASYQQQRRVIQGQGEQSGVVFMTHAMLAVMVRDAIRSARTSLDEEAKETLAARVDDWLKDSADREGRLYEVINATLGELGETAPGPLTTVGLLVVDEAHELERWFSQVSSMQTSIWRIVDELKQLRADYPKIGAECVVVASDVFRGLQSLHGRDLSPNEIDQHMATLSRALDLAMAQTPKKARSSPRARRLRAIKLMFDAALRPGNLALRIPNAMRIRIDWSEGRHYPRVIIGQRDVSRMLDYLWRNLVERAVLASATLYEEMPQSNAESMRRILAVPHARAVMMAPVRPAWLFAPVTLYTASLTYRGDGLARFVRPKRAADGTHAAAYEAWADEVASYIALAWRVGAGGMLILLTSYADLDALRDRLEMVPGIGPLLFQSSGRPLAKVRDAFLAQASTSRPVMLAVGSAWTGLDLSGAESPNALTDLVVPVAPFGAVRSVTQQERESRSIVEVASAAGILLRQGTGRLVRSPDTPANRKLHFLDARRHLPGAAGMFAPINRWLAKYPAQVTV